MAASLYRALESFVGFNVQQIKRRFPMLESYHVNYEIERKREKERQSQERERENHERECER